MRPKAVNSVSCLPKERMGSRRLRTGSGADVEWGCKRGRRRSANELLKLQQQDRAHPPAWTSSSRTSCRPSWLNRGVEGERGLLEGRELLVARVTWGSCAGRTGVAAGQRG